MDTLIAILEGVPGALLATVLTVLAVRLLPPKIEISPLIATMWSDERGGLRNRFKMVNKSRRAIVDLKFELVIEYSKEGKPRTKLVEPERPEPISISGRNRKKGEWGDYTVAHGEDLIEDLIKRIAVSEGGCTLRLRVFGRDSLSGMGKQFQMTYGRLFDGTFVYGTFKDGASLEVQSAKPHERWSERLAQAKTAIQSSTVLNEPLNGD